MPEYIRAMVAVAVLAMPAFALARRMTGAFIQPGELRIWRNAWFVLTLGAFLSGSVLVFSVIVAIVCIYLSMVRGAGVSTFVALMFSTPLVTTIVGVFGAINNLIEVNSVRLLTAGILLPGLLSRKNRRRPISVLWPDRFLLAYAALIAALAFREANLTSVLRGATLTFVDVLIPYFAFSRAINSLVDIRRVLTAFAVAALPLSIIAIFETVKGWPLYESVLASWGSSEGYIARGGLLRAVATAGPIPLGLIMMVAIGCLLVLRELSDSKSRRWVNIALACCVTGSLATLSRGPWIGVTVVLIVYATSGKRALSRVGPYAAVGILAIALFLQTSVGEKIVEFLPFVGSVDEGNVNYRQLLIENSLPVVERNLLFGSPDYLSTPELQQLKTGQNIVDIVNSYLGIALYSGIIGLGLFSAFFLSIVYNLRRLVKSRSPRPHECTIYLRGALAILLGLLVVIATVSSVGFVPYVYWSFAGLCVALVRIADASYYPMPHRPPAASSGKAKPSIDAVDTASRDL